MSRVWVSLCLGTLILGLWSCGGGGSSGGGGGVSGTPLSGMVTVPTTVGPIAAPGQPAALVTPNAAVPSAVVEFLDEDGELVKTATTDSSGAYTVRLDDGTYQVGIQVGSTTYFSPLRSVVIVRNGTIDGADNSGSAPTLDFEMPRAAETVTGTVLNGATPVADVRVQFVDQESGLVRFQTTTNALGAYAVTTLPEGSFTVRLDASSVPSGLAAPSPQTVAVTTAGAVPATVSFALAAATVTTGTVNSASGAAFFASAGPGGLLQPAFIPEAPLDVPAGAIIVAEEIGYGVVGEFAVGTDGSYSLNLRDGAYLLTFRGLGTDVVLPPPIRISVKGGLIYTEESDTALDPTVGSLDATAYDVTATLTGSVSLAGVAVVTKVVAVDPATGAEVASTKTNSSGVYSLSLADGSYDISVRTKLLPPGVVPPTPVRIAVEFGSDPATPIKESAGTANDGTVNFALQESSFTLTGTVSDDSSNALADVRIVARKGNKVVGRARTAANGGYTLQLPIGTVDIAIRPESLPKGLLPPKSKRIEIATSGGTTTATDESGAVTQVNFVSVVRAANVTGVVRFDFNGDTVVAAGEVVGCTVTVRKPDGDEILFSTPTDPATGTFSLVLPNGTYRIGIDPKSTPPGSAPPASQRVSVTDAAVTLADGTSAASVSLTYTLTPRAATLTGMVELDMVGVGVGIVLVDAATGEKVRTIRSDQLNGAYRMPLAIGSYRLRLDPETLPTGAAIPNPIPISVATNGTVSTETGVLNPVQLNISLTRTVATLTGVANVIRGAETLPVEALISVRDPESQSELFSFITDPETGAYSTNLVAGTWTIAINPASIPPGVIPPAPVNVSVTGTTVTGDGVSSNTLDLALVDTRSDGVEVNGFVVDDSDTGVPAEVRLFDPSSGSTSAFLLSVPTNPDGSFLFRAPEGTYELAVLPASIPPTAIPPANVVFTVQGSSIFEDNTNTSAAMFPDSSATFGTNAANDGKIGFIVRDGASSGISINGTVVDSGANAVPFARVIVKDASTSEEVLELFTDFTNGAYNAVLPLGSYTIGIDPYSLPFGLIAPPNKSIQAVSNMGVITVTTGGGATVTAVGGSYPFNFTTITANQQVTGTVTDPSSNPKRVFVEVVDAVSGGFIVGKWSNETTGNYSIDLGPGAYRVRLKGDTIPPGFAGPGPVQATVTSTGVLEDSGTSDDGDIDFQLIAVANTVSGTVLNGATPIACFVQAFDIVTGNFIAGKPTTPATGAYSISLPPGNYRIQVDPFSLPPGFIPSASQTVQLTAGSATANFTVSVAAQCVTGRVVTNTNELPLAVFVRLRDAATSAFVAGAPTDFATGQFSICVPPGNYKLSIDPASLPAGTIAPIAETVQLDGSNFVEDNTTTIGAEVNNTNDGLMNFRVNDAPIASLGNLTGNVTLSPGGEPIGAYVVLEDASTGQFINGVFSDPGAGGAYSLIVGDGNYKVLIDAFSLPPGLLVPDPVTINVSGTTIVQLSGSVPTTSSTLNFQLEEPSNQVTGTVTLNANPFQAVIQVVTPSTGQIIFEQPTAPNGTYSLFLPNGTFVVRLAPFSVPPDLPSPAPVQVSVTSGFVQESAGTPNDGIIPFALTSTVTQLTGIVQDDASTRLFANVQLKDPTSGQLIFQSFTSPSQAFSFQLIDGTYDIVVDPFSLPIDVVAPLPSRITLSGGTFTLTTAGSGALSGSNLTITATRESALTSIPVKVRNGMTPLPGGIEVRDGAGLFLFFLPVPPTMGGAPLFLGDGTYTLRMDPFTVPPGFGQPADKTLVVSGSGTAFSVDGMGGATEVLFSLTQGTLQGTLVNGWNGGTQRVELDILNGSGQVLYQNVTLTQNGNHATYGTGADIILADGTYTLRCRRATGQTASTCILPANKNVNILNGIIQNPDSDPSTPGVIDVNMTVPLVQGTVSGTLTVGGTPIQSCEIAIKDPATQRVVNSGSTDVNGDYVFGVPAGFYELAPRPSSLEVASSGTAIPGTPIGLNITTAPSVTVVGVGACAGDPNCTGLDFTLSAFDAMSDAVVTGTVTSRQTTASAATPVNGARVILVNSNGVEFASATTNAMGNYSLIVPDGAWYVFVDLFGIDVGYPILPANPVPISVSGTTVSPSATQSFLLEGATALITGRVQTPAFAGVGARLIVTAASATAIPGGYVYDVFTDPSGNYFLPVGQGNFKLWVDPGSLPPGFLAPNPTVFGVTTTTVTESDTFGTGNLANDGIINPKVTAGGETVPIVVYAQGTTNPLPAFVSLLKRATNPDDPPIFITGEPNDPTTGTVEFTAGAGNYFVEIDPWSLPAGQQSTGRVDFSVASASLSFAEGEPTTVIGGETHGVLYIGTASGALSGVVRTNVSDPATGLPAAVVAVDASSGAFIRDAFTNPADGSYSMTLGNGVYDIKVDPYSLPPGYSAGAPVRVTVNGATVSETYATADDGVVSFQVQQTAQTLYGRIRRPSGDGAPGFVSLLAPDGSGSYQVFVAGVGADFSTGDFQIPVAPGTYQVKIDPFSVPPGLLPPPPMTISVTSSAITYPPSATTVMESGNTVVLLDLQQASGGGINGTVTNAAGTGLEVFMIVEESATGAFVAGSPTASDGTYSIPLPAGNYRIFVDSYSIPFGSVPPAPKTATVASTMVTKNFTVQAAGAVFEGYVVKPAAMYDTSSVTCADIASIMQLTPIQCAVVLLQPSPDSSQPPIFLGEFFTRPEDGFFSIPLGDGTFKIQIDGSTLPLGFIPPPPMTVVNTGGTLSVTGGDFEDCADAAAQKLVLVGQSAAGINGLIQDSSANPIGAFVELRNASDGTFVTGSPTDPVTGTFSLSLGSLSYNLRVDPFSLPPGFAPPPPIGISVLPDSSISVTTPEGVSWDAGTSTITITLSAASASVSGVVADSQSNPVSANVQALDFSGNVVANAWTNPMGSYSIPLAPGIYTMKVDPFSLPPGFNPPASVTVDLIASSSATANFVVAAAPATITGTVQNASGTGIPAYVFVTDAVSGSFVAGAYAEPTMSGFVYSLAVGQGNFLIGVDPDSVPSGTVVPAPVAFQVTVNPISGVATISEASQGDGSSTTDGVINFTLIDAAATLAGRLVNPSGQPVSGFLRAELNDGSGLIVAEAATTGAGLFSMSFAEGNYLLRVDPASLPPLHVPPPPSTITVTSSGLTIDGAAPTGPPHDITVGIADATLTGNVYQSGMTPVVGAFVTATEASSGVLVGGAPTNSMGAYNLPLSTGTYLIKVDPFSLPAGLIPPAPVTVHSSGGAIYQGPDTTGSDITMSGLDLTVASPAATVTINTVNDVGQSVPAQVNIRDAASDALVQTVFTSGTSVQVGLPAGSYLVRIPAFSVPPGQIAPNPASLVVNGDGTCVDSSGLPGDKFIQFVFQGAAATIQGTVTRASDSSPVAGAKVVAIDPETEFVIAEKLTSASGNYLLDLPVGGYEILITTGIPSGTVLPAPVPVDVGGDGTVDPSSTVNFVLATSVGTLSGQVTLDATGQQARILAFKQVMSEWALVTASTSDASGNYSMSVPEGPIVAIAEFDPGMQLIIAPLPMSQTFASPGPSSVTQDFAFFVADGTPVSEILKGSITAAGAPYEGAIQILYNNLPMALYDAPGGSYRFPILADSSRMFDVGVFEDELPSSFTAPDFVTITVDDSASPSIAGTGVTEDSGEYVLDFALMVDGLNLSGTITDWDGIALAGVEVRSFIPSTGMQGPTAFTNSSGQYSMIFPEGSYELELGGGLPTAAIRPSPVDVLVVDSGGTLTMTVDGSPTQTQNFQLQEGIARVSGQITVDGAPVSGEVIAFVSGQEIGFNFASGGQYEVLVPAGDVSVIARVFGLPPGTVLAAPFTQTITDTGSLQEISHDFAFTSVSAMNPGQTVSGYVLVDGAPTFAEVEILDSSGIAYAFLDVDPMQGRFEATLPPGDYTFQVATDLLPAGAVGVSTADVTVTSTAVSGDALVGSELFFMFRTTGTVVSGTVTDPMSAAVQDVALIFTLDTASTSAFAVTSASGAYEILLAPGNYEVELAVSSLPSGVVVPDVIDLSVGTTPVTLNIALTAADGTMAGQVTLDGMPVSAEVIALDSNLEEVTATTVDASGNYLLGLPSGTYTVIAEIDDPMIDSSMLIAPQALTVTISMGTARTGDDFAFTTPGGGGTVGTQLTIRAQQAGITQQVSGYLNAVDGGTSFYTFFESDPAGQPEANVVLSDGTYEVIVTEVGGVAATLPTATISVANPSISMGGMTLPMNVLDFVVPGEPSGVVIGKDGLPLTGVQVRMLPAFGTAIEATTDMDGQYEFGGLTPGQYWLVMSASLPGYNALPRATLVTVDEEDGVFPPVVDLELGEPAGVLSGQVRRNGSGIQSRVFVMDRALLVVTAADTDSSGNYQFHLPAGDYTLVARPLAPLGTEVPSIGSPITFAGTMTQNIDFSTTGGTTLSGVATIDGFPGDMAVLVYQPGAVPVPVSWGLTSTSGAYSANLPDGNYEVVFQTQTVPSEVVSFPPVAITVGSGTISGTDPNGDAIASNTLNLDPFGNSDQGDLRLAVSDLLEAFAERDGATITSLVDASALWNGQNAAEIVAEWTTGVDDETESRFDWLMGAASGSGDAYTFTVQRGRATYLTAMENQQRSWVWEHVHTQDPTFELSMVRADSSSPWKTAGNGLHVDEAALESLTVFTRNGAETSIRNGIEFFVEEVSAFQLTSSSVSGDGITDGTMTEDSSGMDVEWYAFLSDSASVPTGPSPFAGDLAQATPGGTYTIDAAYSGGTDSIQVTYNPPAAVYPTVSVTSDMSGNVVVSWADISSNLDRGYAGADVELVETSTGNEVDALDDLPMGRSRVTFDASQLTIGEQYSAIVSVIDTGNAIHEYEYRFTYPPGDFAFLTGTVADSSSTPVSGLLVTARDMGDFLLGSATSAMDGSYALPLGPGNYTVQLEDPTASYVLPAPKSVSVMSDGMGDLSIQVDGMASDGTVDWTVSAAAVVVSGQVTVGGVAPSDATIHAYVDGFLVTSASLSINDNGMYSVGLPAGQVAVVAELPSGFEDYALAAPYYASHAPMSPPAQVTHDFAFETPMTGVNELIQGFVYSDGQTLPGEVLVYSSDDVLLKSYQHAGNWMVRLPIGNYSFVVPSGSIPPGGVGASEADVAITSGGATGDGIIAGQQGPEHYFVFNTTGNLLTGTVRRSDSSAAADVTILAVPDGQGPPSFAVTSASGTYSMLLMSGPYEVEIVSSTLPTGHVLPNPVEVEMFGPRTVDFNLLAATGSIAGTVTLDGSGTAAEVIVFDGAGDEVTYGFCAPDGTYTVAMPDGSYTVVAELEGYDLSSVITPDPVPVTISGAAVTGVDFAFNQVGGGVASQVLNGALTVGLIPTMGEIEVFKNVSGSFTYYAGLATQTSMGEEIYQVALSTGTYRIWVVEIDGDAIEYGPFEIVVTSTEITLSGATLSGNTLDLNVPAVSGIVRSANGVLADTDVMLIPADGGAPVVTQTDANGSYAFDSTVQGEYWLTIGSASLAVDEALPRMYDVYSTSEGTLPRVQNVGVPTRGGELTGQVTVDGSGAPALVYVYDQHLSVIQTVLTDMSGNYSVPLPVGNYRVLAFLDSPSGNEVPPIDTTLHSASATADVAFTTGASSQVMTGQVRINNSPSQIPVIVYNDHGPWSPVAHVVPDASGNYSVRLPYGTFQVILAPDATPNGLCSFEPVTIVVDGSGVNGTDPDGAAMAGNALNLDPHGNSSLGGVRKALSDLFQAGIAQDGLTASNLLDDGAIWSGMTKQEILGSLMTEEPFIDFGFRFDRLIVSATGSGDVFTVTPILARTLKVDDDGSAEYENTSGTFNLSSGATIEVRRVDSMSPWLVAGNQLRFDSYEALALSVRENASGMDTDSTEVEFIVEEAGQGMWMISSASVSGGTIADGTLGFDMDNDEWYAFVDGSGSGPAPFSAGLGDVPAGVYTFVVNFTDGSSNTVSQQLTYPEASIYPTTTVTDLGNGFVLVQWEEISTQIPNPIAEIGVFVEQDGMMGSIELLEREGLVPGTNWILVEDSLFTSGGTYIVEVEYIDVRGASYLYALEVTWP